MLKSRGSNGKGSGIFYQGRFGRTGAMAATGDPASVWSFLPKKHHQGNRAPRAMPLLHVVGRV